MGKPCGKHEAGDPIGGLTSAKPADVAGLVVYAEGSVVSRTLVENSAGTITAFAFDKGQGLSEHSAPFDAVVLVVEGATTFVIGTKECEARAGEILLLPANVPHAVKPGERFKMLLTMLRTG